MKLNKEILLVTKATFGKAKLALRQAQEDKNII